MFIFKIILLVLVFGTIYMIGVNISNRYKRKSRKLKKDKERTKLS